MRATFRKLRTLWWYWRRQGRAGVLSWLRVHLGEQLLQASTTFDPAAVGAYRCPKESPRFSIRAGVILDEFSYYSWMYEFDLVQIIPGEIQRDILDDLDILFVESAWNGNDGAWAGKLVGFPQPSEDIIALVSACKAAGVDTIFWNKEDPPHFWEFLECARLFDHVFTTDENMIDRYRAELGHDRIHALSFAAQPTIHNPVRRTSAGRVGDIAFAGMYFRHKFQERQDGIKLLLDAASEIAGKFGANFAIYSRMDGKGSNYRFPSKYSGFVAGSLSYEQMLSAYRMYKVFLNVNTVTSSPTMCSRRVFESVASGAACVTTECEAIDRFFPASEIRIVKGQDDAIKVVTALVRSRNYRDKYVHRAQRRIWTQHTYSHRAVDMLRAAEISAVGDFGPEGVPEICVVTATHRQENLKAALENIARQADVAVQVRMVTNGYRPTPAQLNLPRELGIEDCEFIYAPNELSLGYCLNLGISSATSEYVAKMDDDDFYGDHYLLDQINALMYSGADVVGKQAAFFYIQSVDALLLRRSEREHRFTNIVAGATLVARRKTFLESPFPDLDRGEDTVFLKRVASAGGKIYSADRFNFIQSRCGSGHTWKIDDSELLAQGVVETFGYNVKHVLA